MKSSLERLRRQRQLEGADGGFTLIELLIVIVILGILAAIVVFAVQNLSGQSSVAACQSQYKTIETALESYKAETGAYPAAGTAGLALLTGSTTSTLMSGTLGPWLKDLPPTASGQGIKDWYSIDGSGNVIVSNSAGSTTGSDSNCA